MADHHLRSTERAAPRARRKRTPWDRIVRAGDNGTGLYLTADEVHRLRFDGAIEARAFLDRECFDKGHDPNKCDREECDS